MRPGFHVDAVTGAINPVALTHLILDDEVVSYRLLFPGALPPFAENALGTVRTLHPKAFATPGEHGGRLVRQQRHHLDTLGMGKQPRRSLPLRSPVRACLLGHRRNAGYGPFWDVRRHRGQAVEPLTAVAEDVYERRDINDLFLDQRGRDLLFLQRLGHDCHENELLDPEPRIDLLDAIAQQFGQPGRIAHRFGQPCTQTLALLSTR